MRACIQLAIGLALCLSLAHAQSPSEAERFYKDGLRLESAGQPLDAFLSYTRARAENPSSVVYVAAAQRVRTLAAQTLAAAGKTQEAAEIDPAGSYLTPPPPDDPSRQRPAVELMRPPIKLEAENIRVDLDLKAPAREVWEEIAKQFGLEVIFDSGYSGRDEIRLEIEHVDFRMLVEIMRDVADAFVVPMSEKLFLVAEDTTQKRQQLEPVAAVAIALPEAMTAEQAQELSQAVQQALDIKRSFLNTARAQVLMRDSVSKIRMAQALYEQMARPSGEVMIEVDLISVDSDRQVDLGLRTPNSFPITNFSTIFNAQAPELNGESASNMIAVGGGETVFGISVGGAQLNARLARGNSRTLQTYSIRATSGSQGDLKVGERFPIATAVFSAAFGDDSDIRVPPPNVTFEDLGLTMTVTPTIHSSTEVSMAIETEFKLLSGGTANGIPILANRSFSTQVRLREGEAALISGMAVMETRGTNSGTAGLAQIPFLGRLFSDPTIQMNQRDLILVVRPRIIRMPPSEVGPSLTFRFGPEERPVPAI